MVSTRSAVLLCIFGISSLGYFSSVSASSPSTCPRQSALFLNNIGSQCPLSYSSNPRLQVDGDFIDGLLTSKWKNAYTCVLFYASWCPFSRNVHAMFDILSSMFPQIEHVAVEQSLVIPSIFSRGGIHSLPAILMVNETSRIRYHGSKDLHSLIKFYRKTTGLEPVAYVAVDRPISLGSTEKSASSLSEMMGREPYLVIAILFLCLRLLLFIIPEVLSLFKAFWVSHRPHINLEIFGETIQIMGRTLQMIDVKRALDKLKLCKTRNFHQGARNARVWASTLASVSLGESSSSGSSSILESSWFKSN